MPSSAAVQFRGVSAKQSAIKSLNFVVFGAFSKIFNMRSSDIVTHCMQIFDCDNIESILQKT